MHLPEQSEGAEAPPASLGTPCLGVIAHSQLACASPFPPLSSTNPHLTWPQVRSASLTSHLEERDSDLQGPILGVSPHPCPPSCACLPLSAPSPTALPTHLQEREAGPDDAQSSSFLYIPFLIPPPGGHAYSPVDKRKQGPYLSRVPERVKGRPSSGVRAWSMWGQSSFASAAFATSPFSLESSNI